MVKQEKQTITFYTQGCRLNQAETAILEDSFQQRGFEICEFKDGADVVVVNTCTVTENGDSDTRRLVNKINRVRSDSKIALIGCQAQILKGDLLTLPNVQWVVGNHEKMNLASLIEDNTSTEPTVSVKKIKREPFIIENTGFDRHHTRANLKIQDGCDFYCSFCIIPFARGPARSRVYEDILKEARLLAAHGFQEVVLTGINIGTYEYEGKTFMEVIDGLSEIEGIQRLRISSIEPTTIPLELFNQMKENPKLCRHLHIPLQSGTDEVLKGMSRKYSLKEFSEFITLGELTVPGLCIGTDVIVGFPGETDALFEQTYSFLENSPIDYFHVFSYSERKMARSKKFEAQVPKDVIANRSKRLRELSKQKKNYFLQENVHKTEQVLFEQNKKGIWIGNTDNYIKVGFESDNELKNIFLDIKLKHLCDDFILGEVVS